MQIRRTAAVLSSCAALTLSGVAVAAPASAQQSGLVNVNVSDIDVETGDILSNILNRNDVGVGVAAGIAANVCNISVGVISRQLAQGNDFSCESDAGDQAVDITQ